MAIHLSEEAKDDLASIDEWYSRYGIEIADSFFSDFSDTLVIIETFPNSGIVHRKKYRMFLLKKFPYLVICEITTIQIIVWHVIHSDRHPRNRLKPNK